MQLKATFLKEYPEQNLCRRMDSANTGMVMYDPKCSHCSGKKKATAMYTAADSGARQAKPRRRL